MIEQADNANQANEQQLIEDTIALDHRHKELLVVITKPDRQPRAKGPIVSTVVCN